MKYRGEGIPGCLWHDLCAITWLRGGFTTESWGNQIMPSTTDRWDTVIYGKWPWQSLVWDMLVSGETLDSGMLKRDGFLQSKYWWGVRWGRNVRIKSQLKDISSLKRVALNWNQRPSESKYWCCSWLSTLEKPFFYFLLFHLLFWDMFSHSLSWFWTM